MCLILDIESSFNYLILTEHIQKETLAQVVKTILVRVGCTI